MSAAAAAPITSVIVEPDDGVEGEEPLFPWLPPDDRLWRHPSELHDSPLPPAAAPAPARPRRADRRIWVAALAAGVVGAILASGVSVAAGAWQHSTTVVRPVEHVVDTVDSPVIDNSTSSPRETDVEQIAEQLRPAVVQLLINGDRGKVNGSGVIFRTDGYVLTNNHVVGGASSVVAVLSDGRQAKARLIGSDPETDVAVVKVDVPVPAVAMLGTVATLKVGQTAMAIGSPPGASGGESVTVGVVSALGQQVMSSDGVPLLDMIQTDAPIAPGSTGGALVDAWGEVIGITTTPAADDSSPRGLGFATPVDVARGVADQLIATGHASHVWLGVQGSDIDSMTASELDVTGAAEVKQVVSGSPAAKAGLATADIIVQMDDRQITSMGSLMVSLRDHRPGDRVTITFVRNGHRRSVQAVLTERPANLPTS
jgi:S1-C subfamily serine protease